MQQSKKHVLEYFQLKKKNHNYLINKHGMMVRKPDLQEGHSFGKGKTSIFP